MEEFTYKRLIKCLDLASDSQITKIQSLAISLINNLLQDNISSVVESNNLDEIINMLCTLLEYCVDIFESSTGDDDETYLEDMFEIIKVF